jgi:hypothetical protein
MIVPKLCGHQDVFDADFRTVSRHKFGASKPKLEEIHSPQSCGRKCEHASESHDPQIVAGNSFFGGLMPFFYGFGRGFVFVFGGGVMAWRLWGV